MPSWESITAFSLRSIWLLSLGLLAGTLLGTNSYAQPEAPPGTFAGIPGAQRQDFEVSAEPSLSGRIAFSAALPSGQQIFVLDLEGRRVQPLISGPGENFYPTWSADGRLLAFVSNRSGRDAVYTATWTGTGQRQVSPATASAGDPDWSHDGRVVFYTESSRSVTEIVALDPDTGRRQVLLKSPHRNVTPRWAPLGGQVAYSTNRFWPGWAVCLLDVDSGGNRCPLRGKESYCRPHWSADGTRLVYASGEMRNISIGVFNIATEELDPITELPGRSYDPLWSPDDKYILFAAEGESEGNFDLHLYDLESKKVAKLVASPYALRYPTWTAASTFELEAERLREQDASLAP